MKNIFLSLLFVFLFLINPVNSDEKISFIDMDKVIYIGRQVLEDNQVNFLQERALNFLPYGELY